MKKTNITTTAALLFLVWGAIMGFVGKTEAQILLPIKLHIWPGASRPDAEGSMYDINEQLQQPFSSTFETDTLSGTEFSVTTNIGQTLTAARNYGLNQGWNMDTCIHIITFPAGTFTNADGISRVGGYRGSGNSYNRSILLAQEPTNGQSGLDGVVKHEMIHNFGRDGHGYDGDCAGAPPYWNDKAMTKLVCGMEVDSTSILGMAAHCQIGLHTECSSFSVDCNAATMTLPRQFDCDEILLEFSTDGGNTWTTTDTIAGDGTSFTQTTKTATLASQAPNYSLWRLWQIDGNYQVGPVVQTTCLVLPLELISFDGEPYEPAVNKLEWVTLNEENMVEFQLDYSDDGITFQTAMIVPATGDGTYVEYHELGRNGGTYYRLISIDANGPCDTSQVIYVSNMLSGTTEHWPKTIAVWPNPVSTILRVERESNISTTKIYNITGQLITVDKDFDFEIDVTGLPKGMYILYTYTDNNEPIGIAKFLKE